MMQVSIVIPCYDGEATVAEAVESALAQTYPHCEVVVVDDGSSDGSLRRLERFGDKIKLLTGPNRGGAAARNHGVAAAAGAFIQFLDADDLLRPEKVALCVEASLGLPEFTIPVTDWTRRLLDRTQPDEKNAFPADADDVLSMTLSNGLAIETPLHGRAAFEAVGGFREHLKCCQEKDLHLRLVAAGYRFHRIPAEGVIVRQAAGSVSSSNFKVLLQRREVLANLAGLLRQSPNDRRWQRTLANTLTRDAFDLARAGHLDAAKPNLELARELDPFGVGRDGLLAPLPRTLTWLLGVDGGARAYTALRRSLASWVA